MSVLVDARFKVRKGDKGKLTNFQDNPRPNVECDYEKDFENCMGGPDKAASAIELFKKLNSGDKNQRIMADGFISTLIVTKKIKKRTLAFILKIGTGRIKRNRDQKSRLTDYAHLNGSQVLMVASNSIGMETDFKNITFRLQMTDDDLDDLNAFVNSLTMENGYPCSHRRMKKYVSEVGIDNFTR
jgi:hypothetical protein